MATVTDMNQNILLVMAAARTEAKTADIIKIHTVMDMATMEVGLPTLI